MALLAFYRASKLVAYALTRSADEKALKKQVAQNMKYQAEAQGEAALKVVQAILADDSKAGVRKHRTVALGDAVDVSKQRLCAHRNTRAQRCKLGW